MNVGEKVSGRASGQEDARLAEDEGGSGFIKSGAGNLAGISPGAMYLGALVAQAGAAQHLKWPEGGWLASRGQVGTSERGEGGRRKRWTGTAGTRLPKAHTPIWAASGHLGVGQTPGTNTPGTLGPLSWASPKVAEPMGVARARQQESWKRASIPR